jgi:predicted aminopeptidase
MNRRLWLSSAALLAVLALSGCSNLAYYAQAVGGHLRVMRAARPISDWLNDPATEPALRQKLAEVRAMRDFASNELALPDNGSYRSYADLGRPFVVWNVFAAGEFSAQPHEWCMLVVGCVNYRGYYDKAEAEALAARLKADGLDTWVGGVPAYSTLGYLDDPVLNTFLRYGQNEVARTLFHELAHQKVFLSGDTAFNESFATAVEETGVARWLAAHGTAEHLLAFRKQQKRKGQFATLIKAYRERLGRLYDQKTMPPEDMRAAKAQIIGELRRAYSDLKTSWGGYAGYDYWFDGPLNNAQLASVNLYTRWLPAFQALLKQEGNDLPRFYAQVQQLADMPKKARETALEALMPPPALAVR